MNQVWRSIARAGTGELLLVGVIFTSPLVVARPEFLPYAVPLVTTYVVVVAALSLWCWRCLRRLDEARAAEYRQRLALAQSNPANGRSAT